MLAADTASDINAAVVLEHAGKLDAAHEMLTGIAAHSRTTNDSKNLARALGIAADISVSLGHYDAAIGEATESVRVRISTHNSSRLGDDYNTLGLAHQYKGDYPAALEAYAHALSADRDAHDAEGEITRLNNIGNINYFEGRYSEALRAYEEALAKLQAAEGSWTTARRNLTRANLATLYQRLGQESRALDLYRQLAATSRALPPSEQAQVLVNQGVMFRRLGDPVKALELYRAAQALYERSPHRDGEIGVLRNIGIVQAMDLNDLPRALEAFSKALELARRSSDQRGVVQSRLYRGEVLRRMNRDREAQSDLTAARDGAKQTGLVEEQWKALYALGDFRGAIVIIESLRSSLRLPAMRRDFLADKRDVYDALIDSRLRDATVGPSEVFEVMERSRARTLLDRVAARSSIAPVTLAEIQSQLAANTTLIEYWIGPSHAAVVWATRGASGIVRFGSAATEVLNGIPIREHLIIVPDGRLTTAPFEAMKLDGKLVIERSDVSYMPSAQFLNRPHARRRFLAPWATQMVALADPPARDIFGEAATALPNSTVEVREIARILPGRAELHFGKDALEIYVKRASSAPLLHLATHAFVDAENPDRSRILLADGYLYQEEVYDLDLSHADLVTLSACDTARGRFVRGESVEAFSQAFLAAGASATVTTLWRVSDQPTAEFMKQFYAALAAGESKAAALRSAKLTFLNSNSALANPQIWAAFVLNGDGSQPLPRAVTWTYPLLALAAILGIMVAMWSRGKASRSERPYPPGSRTLESVDPR